MILGYPIVYPGRGDHSVPKGDGGGGGGVGVGNVIIEPHRYEYYMLDIHSMMHRSMS